MTSLLKVLYTVNVIFCTTSFWSEALLCDFEDDVLCGFIADRTADFNWTRSNSTSSEKTGPSSDHTSGSGWFVYIETTYPTLNRDKARLVTPYVSASENCLTFYYHMYGDHVNTLNVFVKSGSDKKKLIWSLSKNQGDAWKMAQVSLIGKNAMKQVIFEGVAGPSYRGDIAIDDVSFALNHSCSLTPTSAYPRRQKPTPIPRARLRPQSFFCGVKLGSRIVGGSVTQPGVWPWIAMLMKKDRNGNIRQFCGGTLIYPNVVLTAAHCVVDIPPDETGYVRMGAYYTDTNKKIGNEQDFRIVKIMLHPDYNVGNFLNNDIALLQLDRNVKQSLYVQDACLPKTGRDFPPGTKCFIAGWGDLKTGGNDAVHLMHVEVPIVSKENCTGNSSYPKSVITANMLCAGYKKGGKDTCQGDSGGPLMCNDGYRWRIVGITSWGYGCASPNYYGVYTRVGSLLDWIAFALTTIEKPVQV